MVVKLSVDLCDAFSHMMVVGLASILEDQAERTCTLQWRGFREVELSTSDGLDVHAMAEQVSNHVNRWKSSLWLCSEGDYTQKGDGRSIHATMSPRLSALGEPDGWRLLQVNREQALDACETVGDCRYFGALGQPAYWSISNGSIAADGGASRWEMVTRNRGQEFIGGRLLPLARELAEWPVEHIEQGLLGAAVRDNIGGDKPTSRTATGLHGPQATDNARAWCALMGVSAFPTVVSNGAQRDPSAALMQLRGGIRYAVLPVFEGEWTLSRYRAVLRSKALAQYGIAQAHNVLADGASSPLSVDIGGGWLQDKGVVACVLFNQYMSDNTSAPERWLDRGHICSLV